MSPTPASQILEQLNWRYAVKAFDPSRKLSAEQWHVLSESLRLSPSSYGLQPWKFLVVQNPALRKQLRTVSWNQSQIEDCSHLVVFTTLKKMTPAYIQQFIRATASTRGQKPEDLAGYEKMMITNLTDNGRGETLQPWTQRQAYIAMGFLMETAALLGVDTCPIEGLDPAKYDEILNLKGTDYATVATVALGHRSAEDGYQRLKKVRFPTSDVIEIR
jgi:nitroreductase